MHSRDRIQSTNGSCPRGNTDSMIILGLCLSNALIGLCGAVVAQNNGFADVGMGIGTIVIGLAP